MPGTSRRPLTSVGRSFERSTRDMSRQIGEGRDSSQAPGQDARALKATGQSLTAGRTCATMSRQNDLGEDRSGLPRSRGTVLLRIQAPVALSGSVPCVARPVLASQDANWAG